MCSTPQLTQIPACSSSTSQESTTTTTTTNENTLLPITHIAIGTNLTVVCLEKKKIYIWGSGFSSPLRVPTLLKVFYLTYFISLINYF